MKTKTGSTGKHTVPPAHTEHHSEGEEGEEKGSQLASQDFLFAWMAGKWIQRDHSDRSESQ